MGQGSSPPTTPSCSTPTPRDRLRVWCTISLTYGWIPVGDGVFVRMGAVAHCWVQSRQPPTHHDDDHEYGDDGRPGNERYEAERQRQGQSGGTQLRLRRGRGRGVCGVGKCGW